MRFSMKALAVSIALAFAVVAPGAALAGHKHHGHKKNYGHQNYGHQNYGHKKHFKRAHKKHFGHGHFKHGHGHNRHGYGHRKHGYAKQYYRRHRHNHGHRYGHGRHNYGHGYRKHGYGHYNRGHGYGLRFYVPGVSVKLFHGSSYQTPERYEERESYETKAAPAETPTETIVWNTDRAKEWPETCLMTREYQTEIVVGGESVEGYGQACLQPDGSWYRGPAQPVPY